MVFSSKLFDVQRSVVGILWFWSPLLRRMVISVWKAWNRSFIIGFYFRSLLEVADISVFHLYCSGCIKRSELNNHSFIIVELLHRLNLVKQIVGVYLPFVIPLDWYLFLNCCLNLPPLFSFSFTSSLCEFASFCICKISGNNG